MTRGQALFRRFVGRNQAGAIALSPELASDHVWLSLWQEAPGIGRVELAYPEYHRQRCYKGKGFIIDRTTAPPSAVMDASVNIPDYPGGVQWVGVSLVEQAQPVLWARVLPGMVRGAGSFMSIDPGLRFGFEVG